MLTSWQKLCLQRSGFARRLSNARQQHQLLRSLLQGRAVVMQIESATRLCVSR